jgi:hypothetical protein
VSETAPEPTQTPSGGSSSPFTRKLGPLPVWAWMGLALAVALGYYFFKQNKAAGASQASSSGSSGSSGTTPSNLVPQFVNQTYVENAPPQAPDVDKTVPDVDTAPAGQAKQYPAPTGLKLSKLSGTSAKVNWDYVTSVTPKPTSYTIAVYQLNGKLAQQFTVNPDTKTSAGQATITGLHPGWQYNVKVWANGGKIAPSGAQGKLTLLCLRTVHICR